MNQDGFDRIFGRLEDRVVENYAAAERHLREVQGRMVRLKKGKYEGRLGRLEGICLDENQGLLFCIYVVRVDDPGVVLNTDGESRMYRPRDEFEFMGG